MLAYYAPLASNIQSAGQANVISGAASVISFKPAGVESWQMDASGNIISKVAGLIIELLMGGAPVAGAAGTCRLFAVNAAGKVRLSAQFPSGAAQIIATEP